MKKWRIGEKPRRKISKSQVDSGRVGFNRRKMEDQRMAEAGCSEDFIASISGHRDYREIRTYVQAVNNARMATEGMARVLEMFPGERLP